MSSSLPPRSRDGQQEQEHHRHAGVPALIARDRHVSHDTIMDADARRILGVVLVNVIVFCVLAELLALFLFYNETGRLFYTYQKPYEPIAETQQGRLTGDGLHPYFGPTHRQGYPFDIPEPLRENARRRRRE